MEEIGVVEVMVKSFQAYRDSWEMFLAKMQSQREVVNWVSVSRISWHEEQRSVTHGRGLGSC